jgi:hypothetical protein
MEEKTSVPQAGLVTGSSRNSGQGIVVMKNNMRVAAAVLSFAIVYSGHTAAIEAAKDWQVKSLKGITAIQYAMASDDPDGKLTEILKSGLAELDVTTKQVNFKADSPISIGTTDALVKVAVDKRKNGQKWVGLYVNQKSKLDRDPSITYEAQTYGIGELVPTAKVEATVKELMARFNSDFKNARASQ